MRKTQFTASILFVFLLSACSLTQAYTPRSPGPPSITYNPKSTSTQLPAISTSTSPSIPTFVPSRTSTITSTPISRVISLDNASKLVEIGRIGSGTLRQIAWSPSGKYLAIGTSTGIYLYSVNPVKQLRYIDAPPGVNAVTFGKDDMTLIAALNTAKKSIHIYDLTKGETLFQFGYECVNSLSFSPATNVLASADADDNVRLWNGDTGKHLHTLEPLLWLDSMVMSPDGKYLAIGGEKGYYNPSELQIWDAILGVQLQVITGPVFGYPRYQAISPDNAYLVSTGFNVVVRTFPEAKNLYISDTENISAITFSADGQKIIFGTYDGNIQVWNASNGALERSVALSDQEIIGLATQPAGTLVASASEDGIVTLWDVTTWQATGRIEEFWGYHSIQVSQDGKIAARSNPGTVKVWEGSSGSLISEFTIPFGWIFSIALSPNGKFIAAGSCGDTYEYRCPYGAIYLWDIQTQELIHTMYGHDGEIQEIIFSNDSKTIFSIGYGDDNLIKLWDVASGQLIKDFKDNFPQLIVMSPSGNAFAVAIIEGVQIRVYPSGDTIQTVTVKPNWSKSIAFSPDGKFLAIDSQDGGILGVNATTGARLFQLKYPFTFKPSPYPPEVTDLKFLQDGNGLVASYSTGEVIFWNIQEKKLVYYFNPSDTPSYLALSPDGMHLLTNSYYDGIIRIWGIEP